MATPSAPVAPAAQTVPYFCREMFTWIQQQGEALKRLPATAENAEAIIKTYEAMFRTTNSLIERMNIPELPAPAFVVPAATAPIAAAREQIAAQVAQATRTVVSPRAAGATARGAAKNGAAKNGSLRAANRGVQKPAAAKKAAISLREYGYEMKSADRTKALRSAVKDRGADVVSERLQFLKDIWGDNRRPEYLKHIKDDIEYVAGYRGDDMESDSESDSDSDATS
jgi:hypothetical protein